MAKKKSKKTARSKAARPQKTKKKQAKKREHSVRSKAADASVRPVSSDTDRGLEDGRRMRAVQLTDTWKNATAAAAYEFARKECQTTARVLSSLGVFDKKRKAESPDEIVGIDVGPKIVFGKATSEPCVRFFVRNKLSKRELSKKSETAVPAEICGVPTDVVAAKANLTAGTIQGGDRFSPRHSLGEGTVGVMVLDGREIPPVNPGRMLLTAAHVVQGTKGREIMKTAVEMIQDGKSVGKLLTHEGVNWLRDKSYDAALIDPQVGDLDALPGVRGNVGVPMNVADITDMSRGDDVALASDPQKKKGKIASLKNFYRLVNGEQVEDHILVESTGTEFVDQGDSGSLFITNDGKGWAVGILRAVFKSIERDSQGNLVDVGGEPKFALLVPMFSIVGRMRIWPVHG